MSVNSHHAEQVRSTALGIDMRNPIADGSEGRAESINAMQNQAINALKDQVKQGIEDLNSAVEGSKMRTLLFHTIKKDIEALKSIAPEALEKLKPVDEKCENRIKTMTITKLSGNNDYYSLAFTRANGR